MNSFLAAMVLAAIGYIAGGIKIVNQGNVALVERLGKYNRTLTAGLSFIQGYFILKRRCNVSRPYLQYRSA